MSDWREIELGDFLTFQRGFDIVKRDMKEDGLYNVIFSSGFGGKHTEFKVKAPGVIVGRKGTLGSVFYSDTDFWPTDTTLWIKDFHGNNPKFAYYFLPTLRFEQYDCGSANPTLNRNHIHTIEVRIPTSLGEQANIAAILSSLDRKISNLRQQNETLEAIAQTLFKHWFVDFEFPNEDGKPYKSSGGEMVRSELGEIPAGWRFGTLGDEVETIGGGTPSTTISEYWENGYIPWYSPTDLTRSKTLFSLGSEKKITKPGLEKSSARLFPKYSLLLTSRATIGEITINTQDACTNQGFITIIPNETFSVYFLYGWLLTQINLIKQLASGSTFPEISKSTFRNFSFLISDSIPLIQYDQTIKPIFQKIENNIRQIQSLTKTRDRLLPKLMSGKLRITEL